MIEVALTFFWKTTLHYPVVWQLIYVGINKEFRWDRWLPWSYAFQFLELFRWPSRSTTPMFRLLLAQKCAEVMFVYFVHFRSAARLAAAPTITEVSFRCESANVSRKVTSQTSGLPLDHEMSVAPSGRFPSVLDKPAGSLETGI